MPLNIGERFVQAQEEPDASATILQATVRAASGVPAGAPTGTELPFAVDTDGPDFYYWDGNSWELIVAAA